MLNLKKTAVAVLALGSSAVFAGTMGPVCTPGNVTVPCEKSAWEVGGYALYAQPSTNMGSYIADTVAELPRFNNDNWNWGFILEAGYHYGTGSDVNVNWTRLDGSHSTYFADITDYSHFQSNWDQVNVEFGQLVDFSATTSMRFHGGVEFSRIKFEANPFVAVLTDASYLATAGFKHQFNGFGPRAGMDMNYAFGNGFGIYAKGAAALLVGTSSFNDETLIGATGRATRTVGAYGSRTNVVPEFDAKLGANYTYAMAQGDLTLDAGYMWTDYVDVQATTALQRGMEASHSVAFNGVYFGLKYVGNV